MIKLQHIAVARFAIGVARVLWPFLVLAAMWEGAVLAFGIRPFYLPRLSAVLGLIADRPDAYVTAFVHTLIETVTGFAMGAIVGIGSGVVFSRAQRLREMFFPLFIVSQTIPVIAFGAIVVLWLGNGIAAKAGIAFYLTFFPVTVNTLLGLQSVDPRQVALLRSFGASGTQVLRILSLPAALPQIFVALRLSAALSLVGAVVGEWFGDNTGLGTFLLQAMFNEQVVALWAAIFCSALLGMVFYGVVVMAERALVFWTSEQM